MSNETGLIAVLNEAAHILYTNPPDNLRWPIIDELEGFAIMLRDGSLRTKREESLVTALQCIVADYSRGGYGHFQAVVAMAALNEK